MKLGFITACLPNRSLEDIVSWSGANGYEALDGEVAGGERPVVLARPGGDLQRLVAVGAGPGRDLLQRPLGHAGGEQPEPHEGTCAGAGTSTQRCSRAEASTASVIRAARSPSANTGMPSGVSPSIAA